MEPPRVSLWEPIVEQVFLTGLVSLFRDAHEDQKKANAKLYAALRETDKSTKATIDYLLPRFRAAHVFTTTSIEIKKINRSSVTNVNRTTITKSLPNDQQTRSIIMIGDKEISDKFYLDGEEICNPKIGNALKIVITKKVERDPTVVGVVGKLNRFNEAKIRVKYATNACYFELERRYDMRSPYHHTTVITFDDAVYNLAEVEKIYGYHVMINTANMGVTFAYHTSQIYKMAELSLAGKTNHLLETLKILTHTNHYCEFHNSRAMLEREYKWKYLPELTEFMRPDWEECKCENRIEPPDVDDE